MCRFPEGTTPDLKVVSQYDCLCLQFNASSVVNLDGDFVLNLGGRLQPVNLGELLNSLAPDTATVNKVSSLQYCD